MADMMPKQVFTLHHLIEMVKIAPKFFILYSADHLADRFCLDRAMGHGCHSEIRNVNRIRAR